MTQPNPTPPPLPNPGGDRDPSSSSVIRRPCGMGSLGWTATYKWTEMLHNPCILGDPQQRGQNQNWLPHPCLLGGPKVGGNATEPLHSRGSPTKGTKSELATSPLRWPGCAALKIGVAQDLCCLGSGSHCLRAALLRIYVAQTPEPRFSGSMSLRTCVAYWQHSS